MFLQGGSRCHDGIAFSNLTEDGENGIFSNSFARRTMACGHPPGFAVPWGPVVMTCHKLSRMPGRKPYASKTSNFSLVKKTFRVSGHGRDSWTIETGPAVSG